MPRPRPMRVSRVCPTGRSCSSTDSSPAASPGGDRGARPIACASWCSRTWSSAAFPDADPRAVEGERRALRSARRVIATSEWTRSELVRREARPARAGRRRDARAPTTRPWRAERATRRCAPVRRRRRTAQGTGRADRGAGRARRRRRRGPARSPDPLDAFPDFADRVAALAADGGPRRPRHDDGRARRATSSTAPTSAPISSWRRRAWRATAWPSPTRCGAASRSSPAAWAGSRRPSRPSRAAVLVPPDEPAALGEALRPWMVDPGAARAADGRGAARRGRASRGGATPRTASPRRWRVCDERRTARPATGADPATGAQAVTGVASSPRHRARSRWSDRPVRRCSSSWQRWCWWRSE